MQVQPDIRPCSYNIASCLVGGEIEATSANWSDIRRHQDDTNSSRISKLAQKEANWQISTRLMSICIIWWKYQKTEGKLTQHPAPSSESGLLTQAAQVTLAASIDPPTTDLPTPILPLLPSQCHTTQKIHAKLQRVQSRENVTLVFRQKSRQQ